MKKIIILCEQVEDGENFLRSNLNFCRLEIKMITNEEIALEFLAKEKDEVHTFILLLDEFEVQSINHFGRHLCLATKNPEVNFIAAAKAINSLDFEVFFYHFPLTKVDVTDAEHLSEGIFDLKRVS